jgi:hypothetical protein
LGSRRIVSRSQTWRDRRHERRTANGAGDFQKINRGRVKNAGAERRSDTLLIRPGRPVRRLFDGGVAPA